MMEKPIDILNNEKGSALIYAILMLIVVLMIGTFATNETSTELKISGSDVQLKKAFYEADGGTEYGAQLLEENIACYGFATGVDDIRLIHINDRDFWANSTADQTAFFYPNDGGDPVTNIEIVNQGTSFGIGGAVQMTSGYEGIGKSAGSGGAQISFKISSVRQKNNRTTSKVIVEWRHIIGQEADCRY